MSFKKALTVSAAVAASLPAGLKRAAALTAGAGLLAVVGMGGTAYAGSTGTVRISVPGCVGLLNLNGGGSSNWATASVQSLGPTCWLTFWDRNTTTGKPPISQGFSVQGGSTGTAGSPYYHDFEHQVAISISNGTTQTGSAWYN
ncbi:hypothetical protein AQI95_40635 [Streptomyces yokosukanensis]|uniref:Uncharacterized protein n=1 Tax=Streptomyces yokosukanensis TaxID=67386 RepID=A0A117PYG0_9ACTN|nr:hypothetical protein [Streptomyces yokosukanensis]KUM99097.1 hypothetical protein AQI95_40635 [Streptomyces yokosukanensis]